MSLESCDASWECCVSVQCERVKEEPGLEPAVSVKQEAWEPVKQEPSEAAAGLYAGHEVKGELVLGPTTLHPPDAAFTTTVFAKNAKHTRWPPAERPGASSGDLPQPQVTTESKQYECAICLKQFSYTSHLMIHKQIHTGEEPHELDDCTKLVSTDSSVTRNKSKHVKKKTFKCDICGIQFSQKRCLVLHKQIHARKKPNQCKTCLEQFMYKASLIRHERFHVKEKVYECDICQKKFPCKSSLEVHVRSHADCPPCALCGARFERRARLLRYARGHIHASPPGEQRLHTAPSGLRERSSIYSPTPAGGAEAERTVPPPAEDQPRLRACSVRLERLPPAEDERAHSSILRASVESQTNDGIKPQGPPEAGAASELYSCDACGEQFARKRRLIRHMRRQCPAPHAPAPTREQRLHTAPSGLREHSSVYSPTPADGVEAERTVPPPAEDQPRLRACSVRLERLPPAEDERAHSTILGASVESQTNDGIKPQGPPEAGAASQLYSCDACGKQFARKRNLIRHIRRFSQKYNLLVHENIHIGRKPNKCEICLKQFSKSTYLTRHKRVHSGEKPYKCDICLKQFSHNHNLLAHKRIHSGEKPYKCEICLKQFSKRNYLTVHKRIHSGEKPYKCEICLKQFSQDSNLIIHKRIHTGEKPYKCEICLRQFSKSTYLTVHKRVHSGEKPYKCEICLKQFSKRFNLTVHKRIHSGEKPYKCAICLKMFSQSSDLIRHNRIHTGVKPYKCDICMKQFSKSTCLTVHKRVHSGEKPYKCDICLKQFSHSQNLTVHKRIHSGEKPYKCEICLKMFSNSSNLIVHNRIHTGVKPYKCDICMKQFPKRFSLSVHKCIHSGEKPYVE